MSFIVKLCLFCFVVSISNISIAQQNVFVVDIEAGALRSEFAKDFLNKATSTENYKNGIAEYNKLRTEFKALQDDAKANGLTWSDEQKKTFNGQIEQKLKVVNQLGGQLESARNSLQGRVIQDLTPDIEMIVQAIIEEKNVDVLMNSKAVYFQKPEFDLTAELTEKLNALKAEK
ncbi:MAG: outer membrane protein [Cellvibrionaceae bacterium]|jgi:outer membrane protein